MDEGSPAPWIIVLLLILFADFIAIAETSLASVSKVKMKTLADHGDKNAKRVLYALDHFDQTISTILICTNISHLATASIVTVAVTRRWGLSAVTLSTLLTTLVVFFVAEMLPKSIAKKYSEKLALWSVTPLAFLTVLFRPAAAILSAIGNFAARFTKADTSVSVTEDELYDIIEDMTEEGSLDEEHGDLISSAIQFTNLTVESILTPRVDVVALDINMDPQEILELIRNQNHSRLPVYEGSIDNIIGILQIRRYIRAYLKDREHCDIRELLDAPMFVSHSANIDELLPLMSKQKQSMAVVTDHYGGTDGIITIEDIVETLVGDIWDEEDVVKTPIVDLGGGEFKIDAEETVEDAFEAVEFDDPEDDEDLQNTRVGEWVYEHFQTIPKTSDQFDYHGLTVTVAEMVHNRIRSVVFRLPAKEAAEA